MSSADYALREAMAAKLVRPPITITRIYARQEPCCAISARRKGIPAPTQFVNGLSTAGNAKEVADRILIFVGVDARKTDTRGLRFPAQTVALSALAPWHQISR